MITRITLIGPGRINDAAVTLKLDNVDPKPDRTIIITPYPRHMIEMILGERWELDLSQYEFIDDSYFDEFYEELGLYKENKWYYQQMLKLCSIDHFDSEYFLLQDSDQVQLKTYHMFTDDGRLNMKCEELFNPYQEIYAEGVEILTDLKRTIPYSLCNEMMPVEYEDWCHLKMLIEKKTGYPWLEAVAKIRSMEPVKWFSEFELLGIYKLNNDDTVETFVGSPQPPITNWDDFYSVDWSKQDTCKFLTDPLKYMRTDQAKQVYKHFKQVIQKEN